MNNIGDLNIKKEVLPIFNYSLNKFTAKKILEILETPLPSINEMVNRQKILQGFTANDQVLREYSYTVLYQKEVHIFLNDERIEDLSKQKLKYKFLTSKKIKIQYRNKCSQLVLFLHRLETRYFLRLRVGCFPKEYGLKIVRIIKFLSVFKLFKYEKIVRESHLKDKHIIEITEKIIELKDKGLISSFWEDLFEFEAYLSINTGLLKSNFAFPTFQDKGINLSQFYHPLIDGAVKNDFETTSNVIILNGPNMSGKSTFLKAVSLCIYLGHLGLGIPALRGEIPFCNYFSFAINRRDDILNGYSHFMTEVINLKTVVENTSLGQRTFAIFDELFSGTNAEDAIEICETTIKGLSKFNQSYFFISTHLQELKGFSNEQVANYYIDCEVINGKPAFTYKLKKGWSNIKVGRILFDREGLNKMLK